MGARTGQRIGHACFAIGFVLLAVGGQLAINSSPAGADAPGPQTPAANPAMAESCGSNVTLVLDASGSISSSHAVDDVRNAGDTFLDALADTGSTARVLQFASISEQLAPQAEVTSQSLQSGGSFRNAINGYYNPLPPRPAGTNIYQYTNGNPQSSGSYRASNDSNQYTNWDQSLGQAGVPQAKPTELVVYVTDGDPTAFDFNQPGDPFRAGPPDVAIGTDSGAAAQTTLDRAVQEANRIKSAGTRMLAVGVGNAVTGNASSRNRLIQIAGPKTVDDSQLNSVKSINDVDVALVKNFDKLAAFLRGVVNELCTPSLTVRKLAQTAGNAEYTPAPSWSITAKPTVAAGGSYAWILPDNDPTHAAACGNPTNPNDQAARTCITDATGIASFQWEPNPSDAATSAVITEAPKPGFTPGRPTADDWSCTLKSNDGTQVSESGDFGTPALGFTLDVDPDQIITCVVYNSFDYQPAIALVKTDAPTQVRGDLAPPANAVTSSFSVTNPGNTPLSAVTVADDRCDPTLQSGDTNGDGLLAANNAETWIFTCTRHLSSSPGSDPLTVTNHAVASGSAPNGQRVTDADSATVAAYAPAISLTKSVDTPEVEVGVPTNVTYTYVATNTGNMTIDNVAVDDSAGPAQCAPVIPTPPATPPVSLAPGAQATFTCTASLTATAATDTFVDNATVSGNPIFPDGTPAPPAVTAGATAVVTAFQPGIVLTKTVDHPIVFPGTSVTYTYAVVNTGTVGLVRTDAAPGPPADPRDGWVVDDLGPTGSCADVNYVSGDTNNDTILAPNSAETWLYTCTTVFPGDVSPVVNTASIVAQVSGGTSRVTAFADATVDVVHPSIVLEKDTVHPVVLDPDAPAIAGPDVPLRTPAVYEYTLRNAGNVSVRNVDVTDSYPIQGGRFCPVEAVPPSGTNAGDTNADGILDPGEAWQYQCVLRAIGGGHALAKTDADMPPGFDPLVPATITNTAIATGEAFLETGDTAAAEPIASNAATAQVQVISPGIAMTKTACVDNGGSLACAPDLLVRPGTAVTYVYRVTNNGDSPVRPISGFDDRCDVVTYASGDTNDNGLIDPAPDAETWEYHCSATIERPSPVTNQALVLATGPLGNTYAATAQAMVRIFEPAIHLTKTVSADLVPSGSSVTYTFRVTNAGTVTDDGVPGEVVLSNIRLLDASLPANPTCSTPAFVSGDTNGNHLLDLVPPEVWTYRCTGIINARTTDVAGVQGLDIQGGSVTDFATATVTPYVAGISVTKVASPVTLDARGGTVTYSYAVTNSGNVPLADVEGRVTDDTCPNVKPTTADGFNVGDVDHNNLLTGRNDLFETGGPEAWKFTCTTNVATTTVNTVTVNGTPTHPGVDGPVRLGPDVTAHAQARVVVSNTPVSPESTPTTTTTAISPDDGSGLLPRTGLGHAAADIGVGIAAIAIGLFLRSGARRRNAPR